MPSRRATARASSTVSGEQQRPEARRRVLRLAPGPDAQGDADHVEALLDEQRGGDGRVDAAAHADDEPLCHGGADRYRGRAVRISVSRSRSSREA